MGPHERTALQRRRDELLQMVNKSPWQGRELDEIEAQLRQADAMSPKSPPYPFCCHPNKCIVAGRCERRVGGELHCCAD